MSTATTCYLAWHLFNDCTEMICFLQSLSSFYSMFSAVADVLVPTLILSVIAHTGWLLLCYLWLSVPL